MAVRTDEDDVNEDLRLREKDVDSIEKQEGVYLKEFNLGGKNADAIITYSRGVYIDFCYWSDRKKCGNDAVATGPVM